MKITLSHREWSRNGEPREVADGVTFLDSETSRHLAEHARLYRTSKAGVVALALAYYFGDGKNHLACEHCVYGQGDTCELPARGEQTTIPLLDKGIVVVGLSTCDQGF